MNLNDNKISWPEALATSLRYPPLNQYRNNFSLTDFFLSPSAEELNELANRIAIASDPLPKFLANHHFEDDSRYYEEIICQSHVVPTRENNWHDFFNALVWMQFPRTKRLLSELHQRDIRQYGLNPRTSRRHHITHFDECGIILAVPSGQIAKANELLTLLANHEWERAFIESKSEWHHTLFPVVFGHAMLEMMLHPFVGLTAKWLAVEVSDDYAELSFHQRNRVLDHALLARVESINHFDAPRPLKPLPILGVPDWYRGQSESFYANREYFRPLTRQYQWPDFILL
ncbi:DUF3025 domain-containing protein [Alteromonas ponticola]|uniref:DUF3025 domain-containing protein n=1 Tax=Alteromonas ponticola TaxID=2720613 RepID=A0ABX1QZ44_9ALTE|nr:DUF3025 domain-containing protein [Alteromonas ponticola]NMH59490.1 DUF3025 domain-containing protein [Alteromonas ponticola]